ncbi:MAG: glycosyltransferase family 4 protein [Clostridiales bacterium]|nr:glycosyltransferase family 4 protein [Clostridiales bacterium]
MKILFVTFSDLNDDYFGGPKGSIRNYKCLSVDNEVVSYHIKRKSNYKSFLSLAGGHFPPIDNIDLKTLQDLVNNQKFDIIFLDNSLLGEITNLKKGNDCKIITFYHNCELQYNEVRFGKKNIIKKNVYKSRAFKAEMLATVNSDYRICFSKRDADSIYSIYKKKVDYIIPLSIEDKFKSKANYGKNCILFGPLGEANLSSFEWFVINVSPYLHCKTLIYGKGFEKYCKSWNTEKIEVIGFVEKLDSVYEKAACVAIPLLSGCGMKVKTAEALMFGKYIFGTDEAFSGYDLDYSKIGGRCNSASEFIYKINSFLDNNVDSFNIYSRDIYLKNYSLEAGEKMFKSILKEIKADL